MNVYSGIYSVLPNVFVEWFTLLLRIQEPQVQISARRLAILTEGFVSYLSPYR
jgi:hypothetical protein